MTTLNFMSYLRLTMTDLVTRQVSRAALSDRYQIVVC